MKAHELNERLKDRLPQVIKHLLPGAIKRGNEYEIGSIRGEKGGSLKIHVGGPKNGLWKDFAGEEGGDLIDLWCSVRSISFPEAILEIRGYLGIPEEKIETKTKRTWSKPKWIPSLAPEKSVVMKYLTEVRKLTPAIISQYRVGEAKRDGVPWMIFPSYHGNDLVRTKNISTQRNEKGKKILNSSPDSKPILFGWNAIPKDAREVVITEGEIDAMSLHQYDLGYAVLSIPMGVGLGSENEWIDHELTNLLSFETIYLCFDDDDAGRGAVKEVAEKLGTYRCRNVLLPKNDVNQCLVEGITKEVIKQCFIDAEDFDPIDVKTPSFYRDRVISILSGTGDAKGYSMPWEKLKGKLELRPRELSIWTGTCGHGKSMILSHLLLHLINLRAKVFIASLEYPQERTVARMHRQISGCRFPSEEQYSDGERFLEGSLWLYDKLDSVETEELLSNCAYYHLKYGVDVFVLDSLMKCGVPEEDLEAQRQFMNKLCNFRNKYPVHIHLVAHPRKSFDEKKKPGKMDIKGSGAIGDMADNCFGVWRDKTIEGPVINLYCEKQRHGEWEGIIDLFFDKESYQYLNSLHDKPKSMTLL